MRVEDLFVVASNRKQQEIYERNNGRKAALVTLTTKNRLCVQRFSDEIEYICKYIRLPVHCARKVLNQIQRKQIVNEKTLLYLINVSG